MAVCLFKLFGQQKQGSIGEYIVAKAVGVSRSPESSLESFDILSPEGIKIEVKTAGYIQIWKQKKPSVPSYDIKRKSGWSGETSEYDGIITRQADVYVFCLHHEKDPATCNPLSSDAWSFYVVATNDIDQKLGPQKSVRISTIEDILECRPVSYDELRGKITEAERVKSNLELEKSKKPLETLNLVTPIKTHFKSALLDNNRTLTVQLSKERILFQGKTAIIISKDI